MNDNSQRLYSKADIPEELKRKSGYHIFGSPEWNKARDAMTLEAIRKYDDENHRLILKESKHYRFNTFVECAAAKWQAWAWAMKKLGVKIVEDIERNPKRAQNLGAYYEHRIQKELKEKDIRCEERPPKYVNAEQDLWKSGMYVYYHGDIVYFISNPMSVRAREGTLYLANRIQYMLVTNASVDGRETVFRVPSAEIRAREDLPASPGVSDSGSTEAKGDTVDNNGDTVHGDMAGLGSELKEDIPDTAN